MMKVKSNPQPVSLVTGIAGFSGSYLAQHLLELNHHVVGIDIKGAPLDNLEAIADQIELYRVDLQDSAQLSQVLTKIHPDQVYHLAGLTKADTNHNYRALFEINVYGTINLLEAMYSSGEDCPVLVTGSSAQYGLVQSHENPINETFPPHPVTQYAVSKVTQDLIAYCYWVSKGLKVIRTRAFNIIGPRQITVFVGSAFAKQIAEIELRQREPVIEVGNLNVKRDFVDVRDAVKAYHLALEMGDAGEVYNISSGQARSIHSMLETLMSLSTVKQIEVRQDTKRIQSADVLIQFGDFSKIEQKTGWRPVIPFEKSLTDLLDYWRNRLRR